MVESLYQDLVDGGGLEAVLWAACVDCAIARYEAEGAFSGFLVTASKHDRAVEIMPFVNKRLFRVQHKVRAADLNTLRWASLSALATTDLAEVTGSAAVWLSGATARELAATWPFADFVDVADAYDSGDRIELMWQMYRAHTYHENDLAEFIEAAMLEPRLRRMFPFTTLWWMSFRPTADEYRVPGPWVRSAGDGRFTVVPDKRVEPDITYDAAEAVRVCVAEMDRLGVPSPEELNSRVHPPR
ncbi:DUF6193 family natural product biosynthesis protein [Nocardia sp. NPDC060256]|uniref:DUF6193 family natural product biosynthesis protein n=1 Tax=unclassified Nocardia TaxID=2637762 RepID=UPI00366154BC